LQPFRPRPSSGITAPLNITINAPNADAAGLARSVNPSTLALVEASSMPDIETLLSDRPIRSQRDVIVRTVKQAKKRRTL
jgi:hypothetical protein